MMFMTAENLEQLTGYKLGKKQCAWLDSRGWVYEADSHGRPRVLVAYCNQRMGVVAEPKKKRWDLNLDSLPQVRFPNRQK